ncbi:MAG TPA: hypothetical protein VGK04_06740 [Thermoanaerobaculia bacterium]
MRNRAAAMPEDHTNSAPRDGSGRCERLDATSAEVQLRLVVPHRQWNGDGDDQHRRRGQRKDPRSLACDAAADDDKIVHLRRGLRLK